MSDQRLLNESELLAALFVAGALPKAERLAFLQRVADGDIPCAEQLADYLDVLSPLPASRLEVLRGRILSNVVADDQLDRPETETSQSIRRSSSTGPKTAARTGGVSEGENRPSGTGKKQGQPVLDPSGCYILPATAGTWNETGYPGISIRQLYVDHPRGQFTALVRMNAGAVFPAHSHEFAEECLVLEGDLRFGDKVLYAGDFLRTAPGFQQQEQTTGSGCLLYITGPIESQLD